MSQLTVEVSGQIVNTEVEAAIEKIVGEYQTQKTKQSAELVIDLQKTFNQKLLKDAATNCGDNADYKPVSIMLEKIGDMYLYFRASAKYLEQEYKISENSHLKDLWENVEKEARESEKNIMLDLKERHKDKILQFIKEHPKPVRVAIIQKLSEDEI
jgi:hypothetical protein